MTLITIIWIAVAIVMTAIELYYPGFFYFLSFSVGALVALSLDIFDINITIQFIGFFVVSMCTLVILRFMISRYDIPTLETNMEALTGYKTKLIQEITHHESGLIKIHGDTWTVKEKDGKPLPQAENVIVVGFQGSHLIVTTYSLHTIKD